MEKWQKLHITSHLRELVENTTCHTGLLVSLTSSGVLGNADVQLIESKPTPYDRSKILYEIISTRTKGYDSITTGLLELRQDAAYQTLSDGVSKYGLPQMTIILSNGPLRLNEVLNEDQMKMAEKNLKACMGEAEFNKMVLSSQTDKTALKLVNSGIPIVPSYYIPRSLSNRICINEEIFKEKIDDVFVFKNIKRYELTEIVRKHEHGTVTSGTQRLNITSRFIILEEDYHWDDIRKIANTPIHLIKFEDRENNFILECSEGHSTKMHSYLKSYQRDQRCYINEDEFIEKHTHVQTISGVCICDTPGMGKSILLANLAAKINDASLDRVAAFLTFSQLLGSLPTPRPDIKLSDNVLNIVIGTIATSKISGKLLEFIFKMGLKKMDLFLDGFDELSPDDNQWTKSFLKSLSSKTNTFKLFLTSRPNHRRELEKTLGVIAYDMLPFNELNQLDYLVLYWKSKIEEHLSQSKLRKLAIFCLQTMKNKLTLKDHDIMGIPLQCYFLAELCKTEAHKVSTTDISISEETIHNYFSSIFKMYNAFVSMRFRQYEEHARNRNSSEIGRLPIQAEMKKYHVWKALQLFFPILADIYALENQVVEAGPGIGHLSLGLLERRSEGQTEIVEFIHRTIAEFILAEYIADTLHQEFHRQSFSLLLQSVFTTRKEWIDVEMAFCKQTDYQKHFSCNSFHFVYPVIVHFVNEYVGSCRPEIICKIPIDLVFNSVIPSTRIYEFLFASIEYQCLHLICLVKLMMYNSKSSLRSLKEFFHEKLIQLYKKRDGASANETKIEPSNMLLYRAAQLANLHILKETYTVMISCFQYNGVEMYRNGHVSVISPLQLAVKLVNYEVAEFLFDKFPTEGQSLLYDCIQDTKRYDSCIVEKRIEMSEMLIRGVKNILHESMNKGPLREILPGPLFANSVNLDILKFLVDRRKCSCSTCRSTPRVGRCLDIRKQNGEGQTFLHTLTRYYSPEEYHEIVEFLLQNGFDEVLLVKNRNGLTPIMQAIEIWEIPPNTIDLLAASSISKGGLDYVATRLMYLNAVTNDGQTILHIAVASRRSIHLLKHLINLTLGTLANIALDQSDQSTSQSCEKQKLDVMKENKWGCTFFHLIPRYYSVADYIEFTQFLLQKGLTDLFRMKCKFGCVRWHFAVHETEGLEKPKELIGSMEKSMADNVKLERVHWRGDTIIHLAIEQKKSFDFVKHLVNPSVDSALRDRWKNMNLASVSAWKGRIDLVKYFVELGWDINQLDNYGYNTLQRAVSASSNVLEMVEYLVSVGADKQHVDKEGETAYMIAIGKGIKDERILNLLR